MSDEKKIIISGIDIGTSKICAVIASWSENQPFEILGIGQAPSLGLKKGVVVNINETASSIKKAIDEAQNQSGETFDECYVGITGEHIRGINNIGVITVSKNNSTNLEQEITKSDIKRVLEHAQSITLPMERRILHVLSQDFKVDDHDGIKDPLGMIGHRLETKVHLVTSELTKEKNLHSCLERAEIDVIDFVLEPLAAGYSVLDQNEKDLGIALIDIGGGTTDVIVYYDGGVRQTSVIPLGSKNITADIAHGVQTTLEQAEMLKCQYGMAKEALASPDEIITVKGLSDDEPKTITQKELASFIEPRMEEILMLAKSDIRKSDHPGVFTFGIKITGGGALLNNVVDLANDIFHQPVKIGQPNLKGGISENLNKPEYSTIVGLINYAITHFNDQVEQNRNFGIKNIFSKIKNIINEL